MVAPIEDHGSQWAKHTSPLHPCTSHSAIALNPTAGNRAHPDTDRHKFVCHQYSAHNLHIQRRKLPCRHPEFAVLRRRDNMLLKLTEKRCVNLKSSHKANLTGGGIARGPVAGNLKRIGCGQYGVKNGLPCQPWGELSDCQMTCLSASPTGRNRRRECGITRSTFLDQSLHNLAQAAHFNRLAQKPGAARVQYPLFNARRVIRADNDDRDCCQIRHSLDHTRRF